ncbi:MAG: AAA family ATPase [Gemmatimonadota bacterium]|nr:AAA family ATPase [Gemmatimonadota bacterium]
MKTPARMNSMIAVNRFAGGGVAVLGEDFTDRDLEREEIARSLNTPRGHMVVTGLRRMGKTSVLIAVRDALVAAGTPVVYVDLWTASTIEDMVTRLAAAAAAVLGRTWTDFLVETGKRLQLSFEVSEAAGGTLVPVPKVSFRDAPMAAQRQRLVDALDMLEELAKRHKTHLGVILDEFQEIERLGGDQPAQAASSAQARANGQTGRAGAKVSAMRQVRAAIQLHRHVTYVFAGSDRRLIDRLHAEDGGALHNLGRRYDIGPIPTQHFAEWIVEQFAAMGIAASDAGTAIITLAGPRTRDVRTLAETVAELARPTGAVNEVLIAKAMHAVVRQRKTTYEADWKQLTTVQQNILRAVAAEGTGLARKEIRRKYGLPEASSITKALDALTDRAIVLRDDRVVAFDDPFYRAWVLTALLPDVGLHLPITHVPQP